jgi:hypothetical protein
VDIPTGIETDRLTFERTPNFTSIIRCPICAEDHVWSKIDAWVSELEHLGADVAPTVAGPGEPAMPTADFATTHADVPMRGAADLAPVSGDIAKDQSLPDPGLLEPTGSSSSTAGTA